LGTDDGDGGEDRIIRFSSLPAQKVFIASESPIVVYLGGFGAGKTKGLSQKATILGLMNAPTSGVIIGPTYSLVRDVLFETFKQLYMEADVEYELNKTTFTMTVEDTFQVFFRSGDDPGRIIGTNAGWGGMDEPAKQEEEVAKMLLGRIRDRRSVLQQMFLSGTPEGFNWFHRWCTDPDLNIEVVRAKTTDNPFLGDNYVKNLRTMYTEEEIRAYINGEFVQFRGAWYKNESRVWEPHRVVEAPGADIRVYGSALESVGLPMIGVDTAGGLGRDSSAVVVIDGGTGRLLAAWSSKTATIDEMCRTAKIMYDMYTLRAKPDEWGMDRFPALIVETNGIGRAAWQMLTVSMGLPCIERKTTEASRYDGMLLAKTYVENGVIGGPPELRHETQNLIADDGKFEGPKDMSMAIGFALMYMRSNPHKASAEPVSDKVVRFQHRLRKAARASRRG
jgi:hypothetical protein